MNKIILFIILLTIAVLLFLKLDGDAINHEKIKATSTTQNSTKEQPTNAALRQMKKTDTVTTTVPATSPGPRPPDDLPITPEIEQQAQAILIELGQQQFSSEPLVELLSVLSTKENCKMRLRAIKGLDQYADSFSHSEAAISEQCSLFDAQYPSIQTAKSDRVLNHLLLSNAFTSELSDLFIRIYNKEPGDDLKNELMIQLIKAKNPHFMRQIAKLPSRLENNLLINTVSERLKSTHPLYLQMIIEQGLEVQACQYDQGSTCTDTSVFMLDKCRMDELLCGQDINFWLHHYITPGHLADINSVITIIQAFASGEIR
ncbi:MAG: hypothetical protein R3E90_07850 [Marinicella sp.]